MRIAIIGAGAMAREHAKAFAAIAGVSIAGICSRTQAKATALARDFGEAIVCDSPHELWERSRADLVIVAVPELAIRTVMSECLGHPWTILMEKPVGRNLTDGEAIAAAARAAGAHVLVGLNRRCLASTQAALLDLRDDATRRFIHVQDQQSLDAARALGHPDAVLRDWMYANSIHLIDYFTLFGRGEISEVKQISPWRPDDPGVVLATVHFASGDLGLYEGIWSGPGPWACTVTTARRRWEMRPLERAAFQRAGERSLNPVEPHEWDRTYKPGFRLQAEQVVAALAGQVGCVPRIAEAMRTMRLIHEIFAT